MRRTLLGGPRYLTDAYGRPDSTTTLGAPDRGQPYEAPSAGTFGVIASRAYCVSDGDLQGVMVQSGLAGGTFKTTVIGDFTSGSVYRLPNFCFRGDSTATTLIVQLYNGTVVLYKRAAGTFTSLASTAQTTVTGTLYRIRAVCAGDLVQVYVDDVLKLTHTLISGDTSYSTKTKVGLLLLKAGAPANIARWDDLEARP